LYKKGDRQQIGNFRPVACLSKFYQLISYCINARLRDVAAVLTACDQTSFCAGRLMNWNVYGKALKFFINAKEAYDDVLLEINIVRELIDKKFHNVRRRIDFEHSFSILRESKGSSATRILAERLTQQFQHATWEQTHVLCIIETLALSQARTAAEQVWDMVEDVEPYPHEAELVVITRDWIDTLLKRFIKIDPQNYDSVARHTLANWKGYCVICKDARCMIEQRREFENSVSCSMEVQLRLLPSDKFRIYA
jgi:hypothetical protein